ncbi:universal stress protein [Cryomorpha ignava]|uniref:Universal stress protein n=1 Tax=Cryomorpha ignava TaxID=101383 RepID=A0A7K3WKG2_9FLAO|nr:universal stress protein [Cryomorpha ignava]NEN22140.1 universal stress protein [Cryomorpha ignava]
MNKKIILVPSDFSKVGQMGLNHAIKVAQIANARVILLHVVPKADMLSEAREKLRIAQEMAQGDFNFEIETMARVGTIFEDIGELAEELEATFVMMGTHGLRGLQFITGGRAIRIVTSANTPFIISQDRAIRETGYDDIVVPLDLHKETKQKLSIVADMAKYFQSRVHIIIPGENDEFLKNALERNLKYAENFFRDMGITYTSRISNKKTDDFDEAIIDFATEIDADLISIMNLAESSLANLIGGSYVQNIITNKAQIPVLVLNPKRTSSSSIFGAYSGGG